jgi:hypothetical protein
LAYIFGGLITLWALAWAVVPPLLKSQLEKIASEQLGRTLSIGKIDFKPWTLELELRDVVLAGASGAVGGQGEQLRIGRAYLDAELQSLLRLAPVIDSVQIEGVRGAVVHLGGGKYDFDDILAKLAAQPQKAEPSNEPPKFAIYNIDLKDWALTFDDRPVGKKHTVSELVLSLPFLSTLAAQREVKTQPRLAFALNGSRFDSSGETTPFVQTRKTDAKISIRALDLAPYLPYLPANLLIKPTSATLGADLTLAFEQTPATSVRLTGQVQADNIAVQDAKREPLLALQSIKIVAQEALPLAGKIALESVDISAPQLQLRRNAAGQLNLLASSSAEQSATKSIALSADSARAKASKDSKDSKNTPPAPSPAQPSSAWQVSVNRVTLQNGSITWSDETTSPRAKLQAQALQMDVRSIAWPFAADKPLAFEGSSQVAQGSLSFSGTATDIQASATAQLSGLPLQQLAPYVSSIITPALSGVADLQAGVLWQAAQGDQKAALQIAVPKLQLANVQLLQAKNRLVQLKSLSSEAGQVDLIAQTAKLGKVAITGLQTRVERSAQGRWMVQDWLKNAPSNSPAAASSPASSAKAAPQPWKFSLGEISVDAPSVGFIDRAPTASSNKTVALDVSALKAKLSGFELDGDKLAAKPMPLSLSATLAPASEDGKAKGEAGKIALQGQLALTPLAMQLDTQLSRLPIHAFEPYFADALNIELLRLEAS